MIYIQFKEMMIQNNFIEMPKGEDIQGLQNILYTAKEDWEIVLQYEPEMASSTKMVHEVIAVLQDQIRGKKDLNELSLEDKISFAAHLQFLQISFAPEPEPLDEDDSDESIKRQMSKNDLDQMLTDSQEILNSIKPSIESLIQENPKLTSTTKFLSQLINIVQDQVHGKQDLNHLNFREKLSLKIHYFFLSFHYYDFLMNAQLADLIDLTDPSFEGFRDDYHLETFYKICPNTYYVYWMSFVMKSDKKSLKLNRNIEAFSQSDGLTLNYELEDHNKIS